MYKATIEISESEMSWGELRTLCETNKLKIRDVSIVHDGLEQPGTRSPLPPDAKSCLFFKTAVMDTSEGTTETVGETTGYTGKDGKEYLRSYNTETNEVTTSVVDPAEYQAHAIPV